MDKDSYVIEAIDQATSMAGSGALRTLIPLLNLEDSKHDKIRLVTLYRERPIQTRGV